MRFCLRLCDGEEGDSSRVSALRELCMGVWFILPFRRDMCLAWTTQLVMMRGDDLIFGASSEAKAMPGVALQG